MHIFGTALGPDGGMVVRGSVMNTVVLLWFVESSWLHDR